MIATKILFSLVMFGGFFFFTRKWLEAILDRADKGLCLAIMSVVALLAGVSGWELAGHFLVP